MEVESAEHLAAAEKAAAKSFVLLKNNGILPLKKEDDFDSDCIFIHKIPFQIKHVF